MAERRMFAKSIIESGRFMMMPASSRLLYYDLGMRADDDGVVEAFMVMRATGAREDDLRVLVAKGFVAMLDESDMVAYLMDWSANNQIRPDRYKPSKHHELLISMFPDAERKFKKNNRFELHAPADTQPDTDGIPADTQPDTDGIHRLGKVSIGKDSINNKKAPPGAMALWRKLCELGRVADGGEREREIKQAIVDYCTMRRSKRQAIQTEATVSRLGIKLAKIADAAKDPTQAIIDSLNASTENCWTGLFAPDEKKAQCPNLGQSKAPTPSPFVWDEEAGCYVYC